ncbi:hypothetical protein D3C78_1351150 [compost metagenome]
MARLRDGARHLHALSGHPGHRLHGPHPAGPARGIRRRGAAPRLSDVPRLADGRSPRDHLDPLPRAHGRAKPGRHRLRHVLRAGPTRGDGPSPRHRRTRPDRQGQPRPGDHRAEASGLPHLPSRLPIGHASRHAGSATRSATGVRLLTVPGRRPLQGVVRSPATPQHRLRDLRRPAVSRDPATRP